MPKSASLQQFEIFLLVAEQQSFTAAAMKLKISKAAVSHAIRLLEEALKIPLFIRSTRQVKLTDEGKLMYQQCKRLQLELEVTRNLMQNFNEKPSGCLRLSCNLFLLESKFFNLIQQYKKKYPQVILEILAEERTLDLQQEQIDCVLGVSWPAPEDIVARQVGKTRYVLCAAPSYFTKHGIPKKIGDLVQHDYIAHVGRNAHDKIVSLKQELNLQPKISLRVNNAVFMKQCALAGMGIIQLHDYMVENELKSGALVEIFAEYFQAEIPLYIYYQKHRFVQPKIRQFVKLALANTFHD